MEVIIVYALLARAFTYWPLWLGFFLNCHDVFNVCPVTAV